MAGNWLFKFMIAIMTMSQIACSDVSIDPIDTREVIEINRDDINKTYKLAGGEKAPKFNSEYEYLTPGIHVLEGDSNYLWASGGTEDLNKRILYKSSDLGESWEEVFIFKKPIEGMHITGRGEVLVSISDGRWKEEPNCQILKLKDEEFEVVLELESGAALNWNFDSDDDGYVFVSEYGYKSLPNNSRKIYRSRDDGDNWEVVYSPAEEEGYHNHVLTIDKDNPNIIYQVIGDDNKRIIESRDRGDSWNVILRDYHPTSALQIDDNILWGLDNVPRAGIIRYNKKTKDLDYAFEAPSPFKGSIYDMLYENGVIYAGLLSYSEPSNYWDGSIFISRDKGESWELLAVWPKLDENTGVGLTHFVAKDGYGFINAKVPAIVDGKNSHYNGTIKFKLLEP